MTEREHAMARLQHLSNRLTSPEDLLHACLSPTANYADYFRSDREPVALAPELGEDARILYKAVAAAPELSVFAKKRICFEACAKFLTTLMSVEDLDAFKKANPLKDDYIPGIIGAEDEMRRVTDAQLFDATEMGLVPKNRSWSLACVV
jgi:hypothetical protein